MKHETHAELINPALRIPGRRAARQSGNKLKVQWPAGSTSGLY